MRTSPLLAQREFAHLKVLRFRKPEEIEAWLAGLVAENTISGQHAIGSRV